MRIPADEPLKAWADESIAKAMAATDPDGAERLALSIMDERQQVRALAGVATAVGAIDSERAARLLADAERIADSITAVNWKALALVNIAEAWSGDNGKR